MDGANEARVLRDVRHRPPDLGHEVGQVGLEHVRVRPEELPQLRLGQSTGPALQQRLQQLEGLGRQVNHLARPQELPRLRVQNAHAEEQTHAPIIAHELRIHRVSLGLGSRAEQSAAAYVVGSEPPRYGGKGE